MFFTSTPAAGRGAALSTAGRLFPKQQAWAATKATCARRSRRCAARQKQEPRAALFDPPPFSPQKLRVERLAGAEEGALAGRRYTLTHNDLTGTLFLSIGRHYNQRQLAGWYTRALRDEVLAEWIAPPGSGAALHVYCHVSGGESWPAPPALRAFIFQREMALVLDTIAHAEQCLLEAAPHLRAAPVRLHLRSHLPRLDHALDWGTLGDRASWPGATSTFMQAALGLAGQPVAASATAAAAARQHGGGQPPAKQQQRLWPSRPGAGLLAVLRGAARGSAPGLVAAVEISSGMAARRRRSRELGAVPADLLDI